MSLWATAIAAAAGIVVFFVWASFSRAQRMIRSRSSLVNGWSVFARIRTPSRSSFFAVIAASRWAASRTATKWAFASSPSMRRWRLGVSCSAQLFRDSPVTPPRSSGSVMKRVPRVGKCPLKVKPFAESSECSAPITCERATPSSSGPWFQCHWKSQAATTLIRAAFRERGFCRITISTSWSSAVNRFIRRSTEKPASL